MLENTPFLFRAFQKYPFFKLVLIVILNALLLKIDQSILVQLIEAAKLKTEKFSVTQIKKEKKGFYENSSKQHRESDG